MADVDRRTLLVGGAALVVTTINPGESVTITATPPDPSAPRFTGAVTLAGFEIPAGETWDFDPNTDTTVTVTANVIVYGTLRMRPAPGIRHTLQFSGVNKTAFVGDGMDVLATDVGLWVVGDGQLDLEGTPKTGWNRTGTDPTWQPEDTTLITPHAPGDWTTFNPHTPGTPMPAPITAPGKPGYTTNTYVPAEVFNLTRNVIIEAVSGDHSHIFIRSTRPQHIRYVEIRRMGTGAPNYPPSGLTGRYALHFHHCGDGSVGSIVEGVTITDSALRGFVPHESNGITFRDCVAHRVAGAGYWWDQGHHSNRTMFDHCAAFGITGSMHNTNGFLLTNGEANTITDCVVAGNEGNNISAGGFHWSEAQSGTWAFVNNRAHNNKGPGISVWQNQVATKHKPHLILNTACFRNREGVSHGAYRNHYEYYECDMFDNTTDIVVWAVGRVSFVNTSARTVHLTEHRVVSNPNDRVLFWQDANSKIIGPIVVDEAGKPNGAVFEFRSSNIASDLARTDFDVRSIRSTIYVNNVHVSKPSFVLSPETP